MLDCTAEPLIQTAPFGNLKYGSLSIRGYLKLNESIQDSWLPFAQSSDNQADFGKIILDSQYENPEQTTEGANCSLRLAEHGTYWYLLYAECADSQEENLVEEWIWGIALRKKFWVNNVFHRIDYFISTTRCLL